MLPLEALIKFIQEYSALTGEGVESSDLVRLEEHLANMPALNPSDFEATSTLWKTAEHKPSVDEFLNGLQERCADSLKQHMH